MQKTTCVISRDRALKVSSLVYWPSACRSKMSSRTESPMVRAMVAPTMTAMGFLSRNF